MYLFLASHMFVCLLWFKLVSCIPWSFLQHGQLPLISFSEYCAVLNLSMLLFQATQRCQGTNKICLFVL